ncbi:MAG: tRNA 2-thiouridine(34) synthase MnmA [Coriobacteriales bacterium]|jgi:tRNA-specific 2-thiouridylase
MAKRVYLGMSGGVDSALSAALLLEEGYDVKGVYMRNWSQDLPGFKCPWAADLADAERVAVGLGIDLDVWDYEDEYKREVVDYVVESYRNGRTPNPDVMCNEKIKFGTFAKRAFEEGADLIATGHYARVTYPEEPGEPARLLRAADEHKDQTYFLWRVPGSVFARTLFPIGEVPDKKTVRAMAAERGIEVAEKPDSDGICFIGPISIQQFLLSQLDRQPGDIVEYETGKVLGRHEGAFLFTLGQRKGLDLGGGPARYVVGTDPKENIVYVSADRDCPALWTETLELEDCRWVSGHAPVAGAFDIRTRHTRKLEHVEVTPTEDGTGAHVSYPARVPRTAAGQAVSIYDGLVCLGGGIVAG